MATVQELKSALDIVQVVQSRLHDVRPAGRGYKALCPFHDDKTPSLTINPELQRYKCWACGEGGDAIDFVVNFDRIEFREACEMLGETCGVTVEFGGGTRSGPDRRELFSVLQAAQDRYCRDLRDSDKEYLYSRGIISWPVIERYSIGYAREDRYRYKDTVATHVDSGLMIQVGDEGTPFYVQRFSNRLMFPVRDSQGRVCGFTARTMGDDKRKYINTPETPVFKKGNLLYGLFEAREAIRDSVYACVVEGSMDVIAMAQAGLTNTVAPLGTAITSDQLKLLARHTESAILVLDGDQAGIKAALRVLPLWLDSDLDIRVVCLPDGEDPSSMVQDGEADDLKMRVRSPWRLDKFAVSYFKSIKPDDTYSAIREVVSLMKQAPSTTRVEMRAGDVIRSIAEETGVPSGKIEALWRERKGRDQGNEQYQFDECDTPREQALAEIVCSDPSTVGPLKGFVSLDSLSTKWLRSLMTELYQIDHDPTREDWDDVTRRLGAEVRSTAYHCAELGMRRGNVQNRLTSMLLAFMDKEPTNVGDLQGLSKTVPRVSMRERAKGRCARV